MPAGAVHLPRARGPLSAWTIKRLSGGDAGTPPVPLPGAGFSEDLQLALYLAYEVHYSDPRFAACDEWDPALIGLRRSLETAFEAELVRHAGRPDVAPGDVPDAVVLAIESDTGPSLSRYMESRGTLDQMRRFVVHRSAYQLKEADPHSHAVARIRGAAKRSLVRIQAGEYGVEGDGHLMHSELFAGTMRALGLDSSPNAYLDEIPASGLMVSNLVSLFGLNRRWRGALVGHLAAFELTSVVPMGRYAGALRRLGARPEARRFYEVHVLADAVHEVMGLDMAREMAAAEPGTAADIVFGARCVLEVERRFAEDLLSSWGALAGTAA